MQQLINEKFGHLAKEETDVKFDYIVGNPPYQKDPSANNRSMPIYHLFMDACYSIAGTTELITPARFLFDAGATPSDWNRKMLNNEHFKVLFYESDSSRIFDNVSIKGGIVITELNSDKTFDKIGTFIPNDTVRSIKHKVDLKNTDGASIADITSSSGLYHFTTAFFNDFPAAKANLTTGTRDIIATNAIDRFSNAFKDVRSDNTIGIYARSVGDRTIKYIDSRYVEPNDFLSTFNVFVPTSNGSGTFGEPLATPVIGHTNTFISIGTFNTEDEANACLKYVKSKFARAMLGILKITQHNTASKWRFVPLQDFTAGSDIDWSLTAPQIDEQLYRKYGLSDEEIDFIESHVKPMA